MRQAPTASSTVDPLADGAAEWCTRKQGYPRRSRPTVVVRTQTRRSRGPPIETRRQCPARWCSRGDACVPTEALGSVPPCTSPIGHNSRATTITRFLWSRCTAPVTKICWPTPSASTTSVTDRATTTRWRSRNTPSPPAATTSTDATSTTLLVPRRTESHQADETRDIDTHRHSLAEHHASSDRNVSAL